MTGAPADAAGDGSLPVHLVDGEMTSWYGNRAIQGRRYLAAFAAGIEGRGNTG